MLDTVFYQEGADTDYEDWATAYVPNLVGGSPLEVVPLDFDEMA